MRYDKTLKKWKLKLSNLNRRAKIEFEKRVFRQPDFDIFYLQIENATEKLLYYIELWLKSVDYKKENPF